MSSTETQRSRLLPTALLTAALCAPGAARANVDDPFAGLEPVGRAELGELRGGMNIGGIEVNFAVVVRTMVEGSASPMGLETTLSVDDFGRLGGAATRLVGGIASDYFVGHGEGGMQLSLDGGATTILHHILRNQLEAVVSNRMDNRNILNSTDVNVTMPGFSALSQAYFAQALTARMGRDSAMGSIGRH